MAGLLCLFFFQNSPYNLSPSFPPQIHLACHLKRPIAASTTPRKAKKHKCMQEFIHENGGHSCNFQFCESLVCFKPQRQIVHVCCSNEDTVQEDKQGREVKTEEGMHDFGVLIALAFLRFYRREISPLIPASCRYVPTCSEYAMQAYTRYGVIKGTILTAWRLCRCNPFGGSGFDPPRWFGDSKTPPQ
eukprot:Gb_14420 [translate_table: standard]